LHDLMEVRNQDIGEARLLILSLQLARPTYTGVTEDGITENAITLFFGRTGR
jgi:hypothetical protein